MVILPLNDKRSLQYWRHDGGWDKTSVSRERPGAMIRGLYSPIVQFQELDRALGPFFPDVAATQKNTYEYPCPFSDEFWEQYSESIVDFLDAARLLKTAIDGMRYRGKGSEDPATVQKRIGSLTVSVQTIPYLRGRRPHVGWVSYSLLSAFAMMAVFDLASMRITKCGNCGSYFTANTQRAKYCSQTCRSTAQMRKYFRRHGRNRA